jgi:hypothetical protein
MVCVCAASKNHLSHIAVQTVMKREGKREGGREREREREREDLCKHMLV